MEEIPALFNNYYVRAFKQLHQDTINCKINRLQYCIRKRLLDRWIMSLRRGSRIIQLFPCL